MSSLLNVLKDNSRSLVVIDADAVITFAGADVSSCLGGKNASLCGESAKTLFAPESKEILTSGKTFGEVDCIKTNGEHQRAFYIATDSPSAFHLVCGAQENIGLYLSLINIADLLPTMLLISTEHDLYFANKPFLDFFKCDSISSFIYKFGALEEQIISKDGYITPDRGNWLNQAKIMKRMEMTPRLYVYSPKMMEYRTLTMELHPLSNKEDVWILLLADVTDLENFDFIAQDLTEIARKQDEMHAEDRLSMLKQKEELLVQQSRLATMGELVDMIAHQWKQPLTSISLAAQNIEEDFEVGMLSEELVCQYANSIIRHVRYMAETVDDFNNFFRPSKNLKAFEVHKEIANVCNLLKPILASSNVEISLKTKGAVFATGHPSELRQVVMNLIINAKDAIEGKKIAMKGKISITISQDEDNAVTTVADNGGGIREDIIEKLFMPYTTTKDSGTGIGLYISRFIMEKMGGHISVENKGKGAAFTLTLPRAENI